MLLDANGRVGYTEACVSCSRCLKDLRHPPQVRISDMGLAADISRGAVIGKCGTRGYWSPEQVSWGIDEAQAELFKSTSMCCRSNVSRTRRRQTGGASACSCMCYTPTDRCPIRLLFARPRSAELVSVCAAAFLRAVRPGGREESGCHRHGNLLEGAKSLEM